MQKVISEEFRDSARKETETRWTEDGLLDIREELNDDIPATAQIPVVDDDDGVDDDFETQIRKHQEKLKAKNGKKEELKIVQEPTNIEVN